MLLKLEITNVSEWKALLTAISSLVDEATFLCSEDGITFRGMDKAHVSYLSITFPVSSFHTYEYETSFFVLSTEDLKNLFNSADNNSMVKFQIPDKDEITIIIKGVYEVEFKLKLIAQEYGALTIPKTNPQAQISLPPNQLTKILEDVQKISEYVTLDCTKNKIQFSGKGDIGSAKIELKTNSDLSLIHTADCSATYSLEYMMKILDTIGKISANLNFAFGTGTPIHLHFELPSKIITDYYLSPRI